MPDFKKPDGTSRVIESVVTNPNATTAGDTYGHGTHVAGIIAGNSWGRDSKDVAYGKYLGIAPDANLVSIKAADDQGNATVLDVIYGLQFAVDHQADYNIRVVNLSLESTVAQSYLTDPLDAAVESAWLHGIVVVAAAGNLGTAPDAVDYAPGNDPYAISVGAVDDGGTKASSDDVFASWSSRGVTQDGFAKPDVSAPGAHIVSTLASGSQFATLCPSCIVDKNYIRAGGTSMAAPVVAGLAALMLQAHPTWTPDQVKTALMKTGRSLGSGMNEVQASGAIGTSGTAPDVNAGLVPNSLVDPATGNIDYTRSSWSRSSWSVAGSSLTAGWARSSWSCNCSLTSSGTIDPTRSSWSRSSWSTEWNL
jgi:serine protease AprX